MTNSTPATGASGHEPAAAIRAGPSPRALAHRQDRLAVGLAMIAGFDTALSRIGAQSVSLTFMTGTLSRVGSHLALGLRRASLANAQGPWDTHLRRALLLAGIWAGFLAGALLSGAATPRFGAWVLLCPVLILSAMAAFDRAAGAAG